MIQDKAIGKKEKGHGRYEALKELGYEQVEEMIIKFGALPYKTYQEWKYSGYQVKKGSKAIIKTKLWKKVKEKKEKEDEEQTSKFILVSASLFGVDQVEKIA